MKILRLKYLLALLTIVVIVFSANAVNAQIVGGSGTINPLPIKTFLGLTDAPDSYTGQAGDVVKVNANEDGLEFGAATGGTWGSITGTLSDQTDLQGELDDLVPYTGATTDVNLGSNNLVITGDIGTSGSRVANGYFTDLFVSSAGSATFAGTGSKYLNINQGNIDFHDDDGPAKIRLIGANMASEDPDKTITLPNTTGTIALTSQLASFGSDNQIPYTDSAGTDFDYSANLTFDGSLFDLSGGIDVTIPDTASTAPGLKIVNNNATGLPISLYIQNEVASEGMRFEQNAVMGGSKSFLAIYSNQAHVNGDAYLWKMENLSASATQPMTRWINASSDAAFSIQQTGASYVFKLENTNDDSAAGMLYANFNVATPAGKFLEFEVQGNDVLTVSSGGALSTAGGLFPLSSDGAALGSTSLMWSDLFLASGSVINLNNGDITLTHTANNLTLAGGSFRVPAGDATTRGLYVGSGGFYNPTGSTIALNDLWVIDPTDARILMGDSSTTGQWGAFGWATTGDYMRLYHSGWMNPGDQITLDSSGRVGIGTSLMSVKLEVAGQVRASQGVLGAWLPTRTGTTENRFYGGLSNGKSLTNVTPVTGRMYAVPFIVYENITVDTLAFSLEGTGASSNAYIGIYSDDGNLYPDDLVVSSAEFDTATGGLGTTTDTVSAALTPGVYWLVWHNDGTSPIIRGYPNEALLPLLGSSSTIGPASTNGYGWYIDTAYGALPSTFPTSATVLTATPIPGVFYRGT